MNKSKSINRLFLILVIWSATGYFGLGFFMMNLSTNQLMAVSQILIFLPAVVYLLVKKIHPVAWIPFKRIKISTILMTVLLTFLLMPLISLINLISMMFSTNFVSESSSQWSNNPFWMNLLIIAVIPAIVEELLFRGIFYHAYRERGVIIGALASGIVFGMMHMNFNQFCYAFVLGIIFSGLVEVTGSIFTSMVAHFVINGWNVLLLETQESAGKLAETAGVDTKAEMTRDVMIGAIGVYGVMAVVGTALAAGVIIWMIKHNKREEHMKWCFRKHPLPLGMKRNFVTPSFVAAVIIGAVYMILMEL